MLFPIGGISQAGANIIYSEIRKFLQDFFLRHSGGQIFEHIIYSNPHAANARLASPLTRFDGDDVLIIHVLIVRLRDLIGKQQIADLTSAVNTLLV